MNVPFKIALRYLLSTKKANLINLITSISIVSIAIATIAMVVVLSAFNGLDDIIKSLYKSFDPDIKITAKYGKAISLDSVVISDLKKIEGIEQIATSIQETCYLNYDDKDIIVVLKGVDSLFNETVHLENTVMEGEYKLKENDINYAVFGYGVAARLNMFIKEFPRPVKVYSAKRKGNISLTKPESAFKTAVVYPSGIFAINQDFDSKYVLVPIELMQQLLDFNNEVSNIEVKLKPNVNAEQLAEQINNILGGRYNVKTRAQLNELIFKTNKTEKWIAFCILLFVIIISAFNLMGAVTMIILDKNKEIRTLKSIGLNNVQIKRVFLICGVLISLIGVVIGIVLGVALCWYQQYIGLVPLNGVIVDFYPVQVRFFDVGIVFITVLLIGFIGSYIPQKLLLKFKND